MTDGAKAYVFQYVMKGNAQRNKQCVAVANTLKEAWEICFSGLLDGTLEDTSLLDHMYQLSITVSQATILENPTSIAP